MNIQDLMQQAQAMQSKLAEVTEEVEARTVTASSGGGMVTVVVSGGGELKDITIDPQAVDPRDVTMLQDLIMAAINDGVRQATEMKAEEIKKLTGGLNIPGLG